MYDPLVIRLAAVYAIIASFCPTFAALVSAMPTGTIGGVSLILYGMISAIGVRNLVENQVDLSKSRNVIVVSLIISLALGITFSAAGAKMCIRDRVILVCGFMFSRRTCSS